MQIIKKTLYLSPSNILLWHLSIWITLTLSFLPNIRGRWAWSDDYSGMIDAVGMKKHAFLDLRIPGGYFYQFFFEKFGSLSSIWLIRLSGLILLTILASLIFMILIEVFSPIHSYLVTMMIMNMPPMIISIYFSTGVLTSILALTLSVSGTYLLFCGKFKMFGFFSLFLAYGVYPLGAPAALSIFFVYTIAKPKHNLRRTTFRILFVLHLAAAALSLISAFSYLKLIHEVPNPRAKVLSLDSAIDTLFFLVSRHIPLSWRIFDTSNSNTFIMIIEIIFIFSIICFLLYTHSSDLGKALQSLLKINLLIVFFVSPMLVSGYNQVEPRFYLGGNMLVICLLGLATSDIRKPIMTVFASVIIGISVILYNNFFYHGRVEPITKSTLDFLDVAIESCGRKRINEGIQIVNRDTPWNVRSQIGMLSQSTDLASPWVPVGAVSKLLEDRGIDAAKIRIRVTNHPSKSGCNINLDFID